MSLKELMAELEGKPAATLRNMLAAAYQMESDAKKELYVLRQRAMVLPTHAGEEEEKAIQAARLRVADMVAYVQAVAEKLHASTGTAPTSIASDEVPAEEESAEEVKEAPKRTRKTAK